MIKKRIKNGSVIIKGGACGPFKGPRQREIIIFGHGGEIRGSPWVVESPGGPARKNVLPF